MSNFTAIDAKFWATLVENPWTIVVHILDILIVAYFIYRLIKALAGTKIMSLIQGVVFFILLKFVAEWIGFTSFKGFFFRLLLFPRLLKGQLLLLSISQHKGS